MGNPTRIGRLIRVRQRGPDHDLALATDLEPHKPQIPPRNHEAGAQRELENGLADVAVEHRALGDPAGVVHRHRVARRGRLAGADGEILNEQVVVHLGHVGNHDAGGRRVRLHRRVGWDVGHGGGVGSEAGRQSEQRAHKGQRAAERRQSETHEHTGLRTRRQAAVARRAERTRER